MWMAAAERAVNQIRGAVRDRKGRTRMPPHSGSRRPRQGPANPIPFFFNAAEMRKLGHDVWITSCSERNILSKCLPIDETKHCISLLWCSKDGGHGFRPPVKKLGSRCEPLQGCSPKWLDFLLGRLRADSTPIRVFVSGCPAAFFHTRSIPSLLCQFEAGDLRCMCMFQVMRPLIFLLLLMMPQLLSLRLFPLRELLPLRLFPLRAALLIRMASVG